MSDKYDWRWPEKPRLKETNPDGSEVVYTRYLKELKGPYSGEKPPMCFPGTRLRKEQMGRTKALLAEQRNHIGTPTRGHPAEPGLTEDTCALEAKAVYMLASVMGGTPKTVDGYFCGGATEANDMGMWIGREWLGKHPDPHNMGIVVFCTTLTHYSVNKACFKLGISERSDWLECHKCKNRHVFVPDSRGRGITYVGMNENGEMNVEDLVRKFRMRYTEGFRRFMVVGNVGTTSLGSIDPVEEIGKTVSVLHQENPNAYFYFHVDAAFGGFTVPFLNPDLKFGFNVPEVMSVSVDGDKMGQLPYPGGIFLCRKDYRSFVSLRVTYVGGHEDDTYCGSRTSVAPLLAWLQFQTEGQEGQRQYVQKCLDVREHLIKAMKGLVGPFRILPYSPWVNLLPVELAVDIKTGRIPIPDDYKEGPAHEAAVEIAKVLKDANLRLDYFPSNPGDSESCPRIVYKLCIMPHHTTKRMDTFVADLKKAEEIWVRHMMKR